VHREIIINCLYSLLRFIKMTKNLTLLLVLIAIALMVVSCYYDNEEELFPKLSTGCDTTNVTYTKNIVPILSSYCYSCHNNANAASFGGNIRLESYSDVKAILTRLYNSVTHNSAFPMPKNSPMLNDCLILQISIWKNNGAPL